METMSGLGEGMDSLGGYPGSTTGVFRQVSNPGASYGLGGRSPVGLATVNAFLEATANVSTTTASALNVTNAHARSTGDEASAIRAIRESMLSLAGDSSPGANVSFKVDASSQSNRNQSRQSPSNKSQFQPPDESGVRLTTSRVEPGAPVVFRTREAREANPERLDLDNRNLQEMCLLEGEHRLRLLNYANNLIKKMHVSRLESAKILVFLDLTGNRLENLQGVDVLTHLRVLLVGKNRIKRLGNALAKLEKLDVLDARENKIDEIENCEDVFGLAKKSLRVLNLSGNVLTTTGDLRSLRGLQEIDLRRNMIADLGVAGETETKTWLPTHSLKRCWLSGNLFSTRESLAPLASLPRLEAVTLDNTPWFFGFKGDKTKYRTCTVAEIDKRNGIRVLDGEVVTDAERGGETMSDEQAQSSGTDYLAVGTAGGAKHEHGVRISNSNVVSETTQPAFVDCVRLETSPGPKVSSSPRSASPPARTCVTSVPKHGDSKRFETPLGVRFDAGARSITVRGKIETEATLRDHPGASLARRVVFAEGAFADFAAAQLDTEPTRGKRDAAATGAASRVVRCLRWARNASPRATALEFQDRGVGTVALVDAIACAGWGPDESDEDVGTSRNKVSNTHHKSSRLESLRVVSTSNTQPVSVFFHQYAVYKFPSLTFVDDIAVTPEVRAKASATFAGLSGARRGAFYSGKKKKSEKEVDGNGTAAYVNGVIDHATTIAEKLRALDMCWDKIVAEYIEEGLRDER